MDLVKALMTGLFFLGWIGSLATVVLFAGELLRTLFSKDDTTEFSPNAEEHFNG